MFKSIGNVTKSLVESDVLAVGDLLVEILARGETPKTIKFGVLRDLGRDCYSRALGVLERGNSNASLSGTFDSDRQDDLRALIILARRYLEQAKEELGK